MQHSYVVCPLPPLSFCLCDIAGSLAAGRWTAWPWRDKRTMAFPCRWTPSSSRPLGSWAGGPVSAPSLTTLSENTEPTSCFLPHWEVNKVDWQGFTLILLMHINTMKRWAFGHPRRSQPGWTRGLFPLQEIYQVTFYNLMKFYQVFILRNYSLDLVVSQRKCNYAVFVFVSLFFSNAD